MYGRKVPPFKVLRMNACCFVKPPREIKILPRDNNSKRNRNKTAQNSILST